MRSWILYTVMIALGACSEVPNSIPDLHLSEQHLDAAPVGDTSSDGRVANNGDVSASVIDVGVDAPSPDSKLLPARDYILHWTGDDYTAPHTMTPAEIKADFFDIYRRAIEDRVRVVKDPSGDPARGNVLSVFHAGGVGAHEGTIFWRTYLPEELDEIFVAFDVYFPADYAWRYGFKMGWGVVANDICSSASTLKNANGVPMGDGINCATSKVTVYGEGSYNFIPAEGTMGSYTYYYLRGRRADMFDDSPVPPYDEPSTAGDANIFKVPKGRWITIEKHVKMNDADAKTSYDPAVDKANGVDEVYVDGVLKVQRTEMTWRIVDTLKISRSTFSLYYGGSGENWFCPRDQDLYFDNIRISTEPITH